MKRLRVIVLTAFVALLPFWGLNAAPEFTINGSILTAVELHGDSEIIIPDGVTVIMDYALRNCYNLTSLIIPVSVTGIGGAAFYGCSNLSHITFMGDKLSLGSENLGYIAQNCVIESNGHYNGTYYDSSSNVRWTINDGQLTYVELNGETRITIPSVVTRIRDNVFQGCWELERVTIPDSVESIGNTAFADCRNLTDITIRGGAVLIGDHAFDRCDALTNVTVGAGVTRIDDSGFSGCRSLTRVTIADSVTTIGNNARNLFLVRKHLARRRHNLQKATGARR